MAITGGFGVMVDTRRGTTRSWYMDRDGVKRWADNDAPCDALPEESLTSGLDDSGKLAIAYKTIMALEAKIEAMEKQYDQVTAMWSRDLHKALDTIDRLCDYHVPINPLYDAAVLGARETLDKLRGSSLENAIAKGTEAWKDVEDPSSWVDELRGNVDA